MKEKGQSLIEIMGAFTVLAVVILGLVAVNTRSVYNAAFARDQTLATQCAQETIERARVLREQNPWANFVTACEGPYAPPPSPFSLSVDCYRPGTAQNCCSTPSNPACNSCEVEVDVSWSDSSGTHHSQLTTRLNNWR